MKKEPRSFPLTIETLTNYQAAAVRNAAELMREAGLLFQAGHYARTYFLAEAAIEEIGKAAIAHTAKSRNLNSPNVCARIRVEFEDHSAKINQAFVASLKANAFHPDDETRATLMKIVGYASALRHGREAALYSDMLDDGSSRAPGDAVKPEVARDCLRLAQTCAAETNAMLLEPPSPAFSAADDKLYSMGNKAMKVWQEPDFGEYLLDHTEKRGGKLSISEAVTTYHDAYLKKGRKFKNLGEGDD